MDLDRLLSRVEAVVREAGQIMLHAAADKGVREKSGHQDLVTKYDPMVQRFLEDRLLPLLPGAGFLGEEDLGEEAHTEREYLFVVDPIDGTTNFVKGFLHSAVSVGLAHRGEPALGVVYDPYLDELFSARLGGGAQLNGKPIHVSDAAPGDCVSMLGISPYYHEFADATFALSRRLFDQSIDVRRMGAASLDLCYLAAGRADCFFEYLLSPWDYAAGALILREAGGLATTMAGDPLPMTRKSSLLAANPPCYPWLRQLAAECPAS